MSSTDETYPWQDAHATAVDVGARVEQVASDPQHGALPARCDALGTVVGYALTRVVVHFDGEAEPVTLRPAALAVVATTAPAETSPTTPALAPSRAQTPELFPQSFAARRTCGGMDAREAHLFPIPNPAAGVPTELHAYCGAAIRPGEAELLSTVFTGAPCMGCLVRVPAETTP